MNFHEFRDFLSPLCAYNFELETTSHYLLPFQLFQIEQRAFPNDIKEIDKHITNHKNDLGQILLYESEC